MTNRVYIEPVATMTPDVLRVAQSLRREDVDELWALSRVRPIEALRRSVAVSTEAYVAFNRDAPIAVFGANVPALGGYGVPWLLGTRGIDECATEYFRLARRFIAHLRRGCDVLQNMALASNRKTLVFLSRLGFVIGEPFTVASGATAVVFSMGGEAECVIL